MTFLTSAESCNHDVYIRFPNTCRCVYTSFVSLQSVHSTMNGRDGIGVSSLSCFYGATVLSSFVAPPVIHQLTTKWTIAATFTLFVCTMLHIYVCQ